METTELIAALNRGEDSRHQFKANFTNADALAAEIVAFSNTAGGRIFIGVDDDGAVCGLAAGDVARLNQLLSNTASQNVRPPVNPLTEIVTHPDGRVMVVDIASGVSKPYMDKAGAIWVKSGADKRRATSREEIQRIFQQGGLLHGDETLIPLMPIAQVNVVLLDQYLEKVVGETLDQQGLPIGRVLENMNLAQSGCLNLAGALLFGRHPETKLPAFIVKAVAFPGTDIADETYLESRDLTGPLAEIFEQGMRFLIGNTRTLQNGRSVNSLGEPEIPRIVWEELLANALVHRDYFISAPVRVLVFADRVEIVSPGHLPNNLTIENIKAGNSNIRNPILASFAAKLLPYRGLGSGLLRALRAYPAIELIDDRSGNLFKAIVARPGAQSPSGREISGVGAYEQ
ncbi:RNA-binding domain-containing protein [uncultured Lamprocystis sp.]|jgi:predicted HTH transcriptional regulator|uniref:RNA-binding domain-containing protein n=1 Tax=uncultured Lamprocystis sp. TaxID=543132 RepID=UPI0025D47E08|nr:RNA-binding domain-containing protein [uncultured Lamprocystis sp.]